MAGLVTLIAVTLALTVSFFRQGDAARKTRDRTEREARIVLSHPRATHALGRSNDQLDLAL